MTTPAARFLAALLGILLVASPGLHAQRRQAARADSALDVRMRGFTAAVVRSDVDSIAAFFPRAGDWTWVHARTGELRGGLLVGRWRFPAADVRRAIGNGGPLCYSFHTHYHGGPLGDWLVLAAGWHDEWRYAGGGRFVPAGVFAGKPIFVQWRREGTEWVVSAIGDHSWYYEDWKPQPQPRLLGYAVGGMLVQDTLLPLPDPPVDATALDWYRRGVLRLGRTYEVYGLPRPLEADSIRRYGMIGRVPVYRFWQDRRDPPEVLYVLTGPERRYQPYIDWSASEPCSER